MTATTTTDETLAARAGDTPESSCAYWTSLVTVKPAELSVGDVVVTDGMRCLVDQAVAEHDVNGTHVWSTSARVLNEDEAVEVYDIPRGWFRRDHWVDGKGWTSDASDTPRWTIQGSAFRNLRIEPRA